MDNAEYEKILKNGEYVEWYGIQVPHELITNSVRFWCEQLSKEVDKLESEISDLKGSNTDKKRAYINSLKRNLQTAPYVLNGDFYLKKKKRIEEELKKESKSKESKVKKNKETTNKTKKNTSTKNSNLIFGK
jgi:hypothetical protein